MPTACINLPDCRVNLVGERLVVHGKNPETDRDECLREIPLRDLERLIVGESTHVTSPAFAAIMRAGIPIQFFSWNGQFLGNFLPAQNSHGRARLLQYERTLDPSFVLKVSGDIINAKLYNQRRVLQRLGHSRADASGKAHADKCPTEKSLDSTLQWLDALFSSIRVSRSIDELRGYEGAASARYFHAWSGFLPEEFPFERRSTRPPLNPVNACISFGATLIYNESVAFCHAHGLDPALGLLHTTEDGRWSLALDLIEPFRPVLVEALALDLFSHQIVNSSHFESKNGGTYLNEEGRRKFFLQYERRMERQFLSEAVGHRTCLRQQLEHQAVQFKAALQKPDGFEPFVMN